MGRVRNAFLVLAAALTLVPGAGGPAGASNDPSFGAQWAMGKIGAEAAWARSTGAAVRIGIVDTGVDLGHEDLAGTGDGDPAHDILSTFWVQGKPNAYQEQAGTSMAAPHVSGAVALLLAQGHTPLSAVERLLNTADKRVSCGSSSPTCRGRLDVGAATAPTQ